VNFDFIPASTRALGLGAMMKGAGKLLRFVPIPQPTLLVGPGSSGRLGQAVAGFGHTKLLIVTDGVIAKLGLLKDLTDALTAGGAEYVVFDEITPDAPIPLIERGIDFYEEHGCDAIVAVGGGSSMDASKAIAVSIANPSKSLRGLAGYFKGSEHTNSHLRCAHHGRHGQRSDSGRRHCRPRAPEQAGDC
jgi:alcohol dehydrogenase